ncbi:MULTISPECIES: hypothetical protein [unclassified Roseovarius]|uniref:hypothetical protein n=1 Tax=unclassified Roseovarius TaxID=2614913 RepID=UPI00273DA918|nr:MULTISPECIES: hypothetical protein [unclassified Roseovarius]
MKTLLLASLLVADSATAQDVNQVFLSATYLGAPTDWCPTDAGVPVIVEMDGPDIIRGPQEPLKIVRERTGGKVKRVLTGEHTGSLWNYVEADQTVIGRFTAEFQACYSLWHDKRVTGGWRLVGPEGVALDTGEFKDMRVFDFHLPFFRSAPGPSPIHFANFGNRFLHAVNRPEITITQTFAAEPDKE